VLDMLTALVAAWATDPAEGAYGEIAPTIALARAHASVGRLDAAARILSDRERRHAVFFSHDELLDCARMLGEVPVAARSALHARFLRWARATEPTDELEGVYEATLWTTAALPEGESKDAALRRLVEAARMSEALYVIARAPDLAASTRDAAAARLVDNVDAYLATLVEVTRDGRVSDWERYATSIRQLRMAVTALSSAEDLRAPPRAESLRAAAETWSAWLVTRDFHGDWLPHVFTGIAWANIARGAIGPAIEYLAGLTFRGAPVVVGYEGWGALFPLDRALAIARDALRAVSWG
jgi:hypothetical protein